MKINVHLSNGHVLVSASETIDSVVQQLQEVHMGMPMGVATEMAEEQLQSLRKIFEDFKNLTYISFVQENGQKVYINPQHVMYVIIDE